MKTIKVCHMTSAHKSTDMRIFYKECTSLARAGYDVYLVSQGESREENGVHVIGVGEAPSKRWKRVTAFSKLVYKTACDLHADIYQLHDPELLPYGVKLKQQGKKVIFDSHEMYADQFRHKPYLSPIFSMALVWFYKRYERYVYKKIDGVIFPCLKNGIHPFEGMCKNTTTVDNYPLLEELYEHYDTNVKKATNSVCYVGGLTYSRGITHLIQAAEVADCQVVLAGKFMPSSYEAEVKKLDGFVKVHHLGQLDRQEVHNLIQKSEVGIAALLNIGQYNLFDNMPTKAYEYMSLGLPIVLTKSPYNEKMNRKYSFGICVDPTNIDEYAGGLKELLRNDTLRNQLGENGRAAVKNVFNWGTQERKLLDLYRVLGNEVEYDY